MVKAGNKQNKGKGSTGKHQYVVSQCLVNLSGPECLVWANNTGVGRDLKDAERIIKFGLKGSPDIIGLYKGLFLGCEIKTGNAVQSKYQKNFERRVRQIGGIYVLIREINVEHALDIVEQEYRKLLNEKI